MMTFRGWRSVLGIALGAVALLAAAGSVHAQGGAAAAPLRPPTAVDDGKSGNRLRSFVGRLSVHVNGAYQPTVRRYDRSRTFQAYGERAQFLSREEFRGRDHVDAGGALRIWRGLELGVSYTQVSRSGTSEVTGTVPHPLDLGRDRTVSAQTVKLPHRQRATHVYASWRIESRDAWSVALSAGPTYFNLRQGVVANVTARETGGPPFPDVNVHVETGEHIRNGVGFNAGADFTVMLTPARLRPRLGVGYFFRVALDSVAVPSGADWRDKYYVGGVQTGVGLRVRF